MLNTSVMRDLLQAALTANETAARQALIKAALKLLEGSTGPGTGVASATNPGVPAAGGPPSPLSPQTLRGCAHPAGQRRPMGGFGATSTQFYCGACDRVVEK
jgi:hypothetical protein